MIVMVEVSVGQTEDYGSDDESRTAEACERLDTLVPTVSARIPG